MDPSTIAALRKNSQGQRHLGSLRKNCIPDHRRDAEPLFYLHRPAETCQGWICEVQPLGEIQQNSCWAFAGDGCHDY